LIFTGDTQMTTRNILIMPGDGIGPEVMAEVERLVSWLNTRISTRFETTRELVGGASYDVHGTPVTEAAMQKALSADAVLFGAVGGPKWAGVDYDKRPEAALLRLRKDLGLFANLRPALCFDALKASSTLKPEIVAGLDIMIVRELTGGVYFGEPRGITTLPNGERQAVDTQVYATHEIHRIARVAFELARLRGNKVASAEKHNVMTSGLLWKEEVTSLHAAEYKDVELTHILADNCAMQLVRNPKQFDVIVTDNLFGDILSDEAAQLTGSIGMLPSASLGARDATTGRQRALYEPIHGSAPDIAGQGKANPIAAILSFAMCLRYSFAMKAEAEAIERAVAAVLDQGLRTGDIMQPGMKLVGTNEMGSAILAALQQNA
jgi:3-isopropylmalate dehydrogenase